MKSEKDKAMSGSAYYVTGANRYIKIDNCTPHTVILINKHYMTARRYTWNTYCKRSEVHNRKVFDAIIFWRFKLYLDIYNIPYSIGELDAKGNKLV